MLPRPLPSLSLSLSHWPADGGVRSCQGNGESEERHCEGAAPGRVRPPDVPHLGQTHHPFCRREDPESGTGVYITVCIFMASFQHLQIAMIHPDAVTSCNVDLENLISDTNRSIATLAITTLLKVSLCLLQAPYTHLTAAASVRPLVPRASSSPAPIARLYYMLIL